jgi:hypothetical protein
MVMGILGLGGGVSDDARVPVPLRVAQVWAAASPAALNPQLRDAIGWYSGLGGRLDEATAKEPSGN